MAAEPDPASQSIAVRLAWLLHDLCVDWGFCLAAAKQHLVDASGDRTIRSILFDIARGNVWPAPYTGRVLRNEFTERWRGREADLLQHQDQEAPRYAEARAAGDYRTAALIAGEVVDLIADIPPAAEIVERTVREATSLLAQASNRYRVG